jgi:hypothetical protein
LIPANLMFPPMVIPVPSQFRVGVERWLPLPNVSTCSALLPKWVRDGRPDPVALLVLDEDSRLLFLDVIIVAACTEYIHARRDITPRPAAAVPYRPDLSRQVAQRTTSTLRPVGRRTTSSSRWSSTRLLGGLRQPGTSSSTGAERSRLRPAGGPWRLHAGGGPSDYPFLSGAATRRQCKAALREMRTATWPALVSVDPQSIRICASLQFVVWTCLAPARRTQLFHVDQNSRMSEPNFSYTPNPIAVVQC